MKLTWNRLIKEEGSRFGAVKSRGNLVERSKLQGSWSRTYMNELDERSRTTTSLEEVSAQKGRERREKITVFGSLHVWRSITEALEQLLLARSSLEPREIRRWWISREGFLGCSWCGCRAERGREKRGREMWGCGCLSRID